MSASTSYVPSPLALSSALSVVSGAAHSTRQGKGTTHATHGTTGGALTTRGSRRRETSKDRRKNKRHGHRVNTSASTGSKMSDSSDTSFQPSKPQINDHASLPMTAATTLKLHGRQLTPFEQSEVLELQKIWFVGNTPNKVRGLPHASNNNGYDDDRGDYRLVMHDHIDYRYEVLSVLGKGSFGQVVKARDHKDGSICALKMIRNKKRFHHQAMVEVKILDHLANKDQDGRHHLVRMQRYFYFRNHLCITFQLLGLNLYEHIKANSFRGMPMPAIRRIASQLLVSLDFLSRQRIIHCDLKPENILLCPGSKSSVKLIDFGSSCFDDQCVYTYIQSRFYRSPEVILGLPYGLSIDMWSLGCILSELYTGYPLFPGEDEPEQIQCMMEVLGLPPRKLVESASRRRKFFDDDGNPFVVPSSRGRVRRAGTKDLATATRSNDAQFISFLRACLKWDPKSRMTPAQGLQHPWLAAEVAAALPRQPSSSRKSHHRRTSASSASEQPDASPPKQFNSYQSGTSKRKGAHAYSALPDQTDHTSSKPQKQRTTKHGHAYENLKRKPQAAKQKPATESRPEESALFPPLSAAGDTQPVDSKTGTEKSAAGTEPRRRTAGKVQQLSQMFESLPLVQVTTR